MRMKKLLSLVAAAALTFSMAACGSTNNGSDTIDQSGDTIQTPSAQAVEGAIDVVSREAGSGTRSAFEEIIGFNEGLPASLFVFKTIADPFVGRISLFKVATGRVHTGMTLYNTNKKEYEKLNKLYVMRGKELIEVDETEKLFSQPTDKRTEDYITGRFGWYEKQIWWTTCIDE